MSETGHQLLGTGAGCRRHGVPRLAKVVKSQLWVDVNTNCLEFVNVEGMTERLCERSICSFDDVRVYPHRHGRV
jgi:hypothetical protein